MKYVEIAAFDRLSNQLCFELNDTQVVGGVELFTTKISSGDRKLQRVLDKSIESRYDDDEVAIEIDSTGTSLSTSFPLNPMLNQGLSSSLGSVELLSPPHSLDKRRRSSHNTPFGPMDQGSNRKQYLYLISVLNASDPDRDFSGLQPDLFEREYSLSKVMNTVNSTLNNMGCKVPAQLWDTLDEQICLRDCNCYSLVMPDRVLADEQGCVWARMWFWFNKKRKRVVFMHLRARRFVSPDLKPEDDEVIGFMDFDST